MCRRASNNSVGLCHTPLPSSERIVPALFSALCYCRRLYMYAGDWVGMPVGCRAIVFSSFALLSTSHVDIRSNASQLWKAIEKRTKRKSWLTSRWQIVNQLKRHLYSTANLTQISIDWSINSLIALFLYCQVMCLLVCLVTLAASSGKRNVAVWRPSASPSVCLSREHTHRDSPACDAASVHFGPRISSTDILVFSRYIRIKHQWQAFCKRFRRKSFFKNSVTGWNLWNSNLYVKCSSI